MVDLIRRFLMGIFNILLILWLFTLSINAQKQVRVMNTFDEFEQEYLTDLASDTIYVVNFWATWCGPCVKELPYFEALNSKYHNTNFKQILVSLDDPKKVDNKLLPFIEKQKLKTTVVLLADGRANQWIDKIDPAWSGSIPITLIFFGGKKYFYEQEFHSTEELETLILPFLR